MHYAALIILAPHDCIHTHSRTALLLHHVVTTTITPYIYIRIFHLLRNTV